MNQTPPRFGRIIKLLSQRWRESETDLTLETAIVGLIARGQLSDKEGARWLSRVTTSPQLAAILRNFASGDWDEQKLKDFLRSYKSAEDETQREKADAVPASPNGKVAALLVQRWDDIQQDGQSHDDLANEKAIVGLIARGELSEREGARWLSRLTTSPQFAAILRNYASDSWDDDRFRALFRAYKAEGDATLSRGSPEAAKPSPDEKIADMVVERWRDADEDLTHERAVVGLIARGQLSEREGARWLSRLTTSPQFGALLRNYASDNWDDDRFKTLFRSYNGLPAETSPSEKIAKQLVQRWDETEDSETADNEVAQEKAIVGLIARGELSEREGARWLSRLTTNPQFAALLRNYASDNWDDDRFRTLFRSYNALPPEASPSEKIAKQLVQRWDEGAEAGGEEEIAQEKAIVGLVARGELTEREAARWLSRLTTNPQFAALLRNYASDNWDDDRFRTLFRSYNALPPEASPSEKIAKQLVQRWDEGAKAAGEEEIAQEKAIVGLVARGELTEREAARWLGRLTTNPQFAALLRNYASDNWDDDRFRTLFRSYNALPPEASPSEKIAKQLVQRWDEGAEAAGEEEIAQEKAIVGLVARGELTEREAARWLGRLTTNPQFAALLRNYASDNWDDDRFKALFRAYKSSGREGDGPVAKTSPDDKITLMVAERWRGAKEDLAHEKAIVGMIARGEFSERESARWLSRVTTNPQLAALLRNYASDEWDDERFKALFRAYKSGGDEDGGALSPDDRLTGQVAERWRGSGDDLTHERTIVGLIARGELSERESARWLSRVTTNPQFAALLRNYASHEWDDDRFKALFRAYKSVEGNSTASPNDKIAKTLAQRWDDIERSEAGGEDLSKEKSIIALIARGELSDREGSRWLSRLTKNPQFATLLRDYASDDWDDEKFNDLFRAYKSGEGGGVASPNDKLAKALAQRWDDAEPSATGETLAQEKSIVSLIVRGDLSEREGARWLSRLATNQQFATLLRNYASDDWDDERFRDLFRAYRISEAGEGQSEAPRFPYRRVAKLLVQRWENASDDLVYEKAVVSLVVRGQLTDKESARWLSRFVSSPFLSRLLRDYALEDWSEERFANVHRLMKGGSWDGASSLDDKVDNSRHDKILKGLADRWWNTGDKLRPEKSIVGLIARGQLSEREGARWLSRLVASPHLGGLLRDYASDDWDEAKFRQVFRIYRSPDAVENATSAFKQLGPAAPAKLGMLSRLGKNRRSPTRDTRYIVLNSFPKSGNTWVRQFLSCLCFDGDLQAVPDHYHHEISQAPVFKLPSGDAVRFYKSHDKTLPAIVDGRAIEHAGAIHIRRHPLDVFISYLNFKHLSRVDSERSMSRSSPFIVESNSLADIADQDLTWAFFGAFMVFGTLNPKFQDAGSWFQNVEEWTALKDELPVVSLKYESLMANGADDLMELGKMLGKSPDDVRAAFARAQDLTVVDGQFFWRQEIGAHKLYLSPAQIDAFYKIHGDKLRQFGY